MNCAGVLASLLAGHFGFWGEVLFLLLAPVVIWPGNVPPRGANGLAASFGKETGS